MPSNNYIYKMSNAGGMSTVTRYTDMLAGNATFDPWTPSGAYDSIATTTVGAGGAASVTFSSIPSTYTHLQIRGIVKGASGSASYMGMTFNGVTTGTPYDMHYLQGNGTAASANAYITRNDIPVFPNGMASTTGFGGFIIDILDYANTNKNKTTRSLDGYDDNGSGQLYFESGLWRSTAAITSITLTKTSSALYDQYSSFALYGVKGS